jgi:hypothetical protein
LLVMWRVKLLAFSSTGWPANRAACIYRTWDDHSAARQNAIAISQLGQTICSGSIVIPSQQRLL